MARKWRDQTIIFDPRVIGRQRHCNCVTVNATGDRAVPQTHTSGRYCLYPLARSSLYRYRALRWSRWSADLSSWRPLAVRARRRSGSHSWRRRRQGGVRRGRPLLSRPRAAVGSGGPGLRACGRLLSRESDRRMFDRTSIPLDPVVARSCVAGALVRVAMVVRFCCMSVCPRVSLCVPFVRLCPMLQSPSVSFDVPVTD